MRQISQPNTIKHREGVFISYSHKDEPKWLELLLHHLKSLEEKGVEIWTDKEIETGEKWHDSIQNSLAKAKVAILLVTPAFLESTYIASHELPAFLKAAESEGLVIFWIPVKPSSYKQTKIAQFQAAHPPIRPLSGLRRAKLDQAFVDIASKLENAVNTQDELKKKLEKIIVGKYKIIKEIGSEGVMFKVYQAKDTALDRYVAIKVVQDKKYDSDFKEILMDASKNGGEGS